MREMPGIEYVDTNQEVVVVVFNLGARLSLVLGAINSEKE